MRGQIYFRRAVATTCATYAEAGGAMVDVGLPGIPAGPARPVLLPCVDAPGREATCPTDAREKTQDTTIIDSIPTALKPRD
ncbi:hypothetical protein GCM10009555_080980 [Acrocarpospora macrocephala]|uniref:Uncharacterized protein n=1 Tax=Acrocarpospora macrocephala TaxID=150177 RepID=A0A5M3X3P5_9ACTN|nr:hypothetical protein [Acrocarpospora macrocephala]GES15670.1 hypothetical protein Amac_092680 [Acrocarpospora macrocephala]